MDVGDKQDGEKLQNATVAAQLSVFNHFSST